MEYRLLKNNQQLGPYSVDQIQVFLKQGLVTTDDQVWAEGWPSWMPIGNVPGLTFQSEIQQQASSPPSVGKTPTTETKGIFNKDELRSICKKQNLLMWSIVAGFGAGVISFLIPAVSFLAFIAADIFGIYAFYSLGTSLRMRVVWLYCIGLFIPVVGLLILFWVSGKASTVLKAVGVKIGLMGGNADDIKD